MEITATYNPPPKQEGTITLTLPISVAARVAAITNLCNGCAKTGLDDLGGSRLYEAFKEAIPDEHKLKLVEVSGNGAEAPTIDLYNKLRFVPLVEGD